MRLELAEPCDELRGSYLGLVGEFLARREPPIPFSLGFPTRDFRAFLGQIRDCAAGVGLPAGFVPHTTYWLVRDGRDVVGVSNLRHELTEALRLRGGHIGYGIRPSERRKGYATCILGLTLGKARERGIGPVLVTCLKGNIGSAKAIQKNGGVLEAEYPLEGQPDLMQRYWIAV
jgi:predicted acetyltransferase